MSAPRPATLRYAHQTDPARADPAETQSARSPSDAFFFLMLFAKSSLFVPVTQGKSKQAHLRRVQVRDLWEKTAWNLNISDLESLLFIFFFSFSHSLVKILHIYHRDSRALMHSWQGEYRRSR